MSFESDMRFRYDLHNVNHEKMSKIHQLANYSTESAMQQSTHIYMPTDPRPISRYLILSALLGPAGFLMATRQFQTTIRSLSRPVVIQKHQRTPILTHSFKKLRFWAKKWILTGLSGCLKLSNIWPKIHKNSDFGDFFGKERAFLRVSRVTTRRKSF